MSTKTSRVRRVMVGFVATLTLAGVGASAAVAGSVTSAHGHAVVAKNWLGG